MRRLALRLAVVPCLVALPLVAAEPPVVRVVDFETTVNVISAKRITRAIDDAEQAGDELVLVRLDTPGGFVSAMETIVKRMLAAKVPVVVWVGPAGAGAGSAGFVIMIAADVAAMAPGTRAGAASVINPQGENREGDISLKKANEDVAALVRSIAERRGRNVEACEQAVQSSRSYEDVVALEQGMIDLVAADREDLLRQLDGREVRLFDGTTVVLRTGEVTIVEGHVTLSHRVMELLAHPSVAVGLFMLGLLGIYVEITHPGLILPGVVGVLSLLLFGMAAQVLPISTAGVLLILLALVMFLLEIKVTSYGMLSVGGVIALVLGTLMLVDGPIPELRVPWHTVLPLAVTVSGLCLGVAWFAIRAQRDRVDTGVEGLAGEVGTVTEDLAPDGKVFVHGELWNAATSGATLPRGTRVSVERVDGLRLVVRPVAEPPAERS